MPPEKKIINFSLKCSACKNTKHVSEFYSQKDKKSGYNSRCILCVRTKTRTRHSALLNDDPIIINGVRVCNICKQEKSLIKFGIDKEGVFGRAYKCLECKVIKESRKQGERLYGVIFEEKEKILSSQMGLCANRACGQQIKFNTKIRKEMAVLDHDHSTGKVRELLCSRCNLVLGLLENERGELRDKNLAFGLTEYLQKHSS